MNNKYKFKKLGKTKIILRKYGEIPVSVPQDRNPTFEVKIVSKGAKDISGIEEKIISYTRGLSKKWTSLKKVKSKK